MASAELPMAGTGYLPRTAPKRSQAAAWLLFGVLLFQGGCAKRESQVDEAAREKILLFGNGSEPETLDPNIEAAAIENTIESALFEGLVNIAIDGATILPGVAESWDLSEDGLVYTFHLRGDARWSDGSPVTAEDFVFSFRRVFDPAMGCIVADTGYAIAGSTAYVTGSNAAPESLGVRAVDPRTFELRLEHPAPYILFIVGGAPYFPVPKAVVERYGGVHRRDSGWSRPGNLVSNGAFQLKSWVSNANVTVSKNPYYWDRAHVRLSEIRFFPTENPETEEHTYRSGGLHLTYRVPSSKLAVYRERRDPQFHVTPILGTWFTAFNVTRPPFDKVAVRRAFCLAIDRERLVPEVIHDQGSPAHSLTRPGTGDYTPPVSKDHDPDLARRLLAEAGYPGGAGFPEVEFTTRDSGSDPVMAEALQQVWLRELGVRVKIAQLESKVAINAFHSLDFSFGLTGYFYEEPSAEFILTLARGGSSSNMTGWRNEAFDREFTAAEKAQTHAAHSAAIDAMERIIQDEVPYSPIYFYNQCQLVHPRLRGWRGNPLQQVDWRELWLDDSQPGR